MKTELQGCCISIFRHIDPPCMQTGTKMYVTEVNLHKGFDTLWGVRNDSNSCVSIVQPL